MDNDGLLIWLTGLCIVLWVQVVRLERRVADLEEDADLDTVPAGDGSLLEAKKAIVKRAVVRAEARGRRS